MKKYIALFLLMCLPYRMVTTVTEIEQIDEEIYRIDCTATDGNIWSFFDDRDTWRVGDISILIMDRNDVSDPYDDAVVDALRIHH